jgi:hypothetical protein
LNAAEKKAWNSYVSAMPATWFRPEALPLLRDLCRATTWADRFVGRMEAIEEHIAQVSRDLTDEDDPDEQKKLTATLEFQSTRFDITYRQWGDACKLATSLSVKLRLTPQSRYEPAVASTSVRRYGGPEQHRRKPWETDEE